MRTVDMVGFVSNVSGREILKKECWVKEMDVKVAYFDHVLY